MFTAEDVKSAFERLTGLGRPTRAEALAAVKARKAHCHRFADDGLVPNNPDLPLVLYRTPVRLTAQFDPAAIFEELFAANGWADGWRDGVYDFTHYHSRTHEVLGIARGSVRVRFGGAKGWQVDLKAGDVAILPAGVGHKRLRASDDLLVVGAYPASGSYNEYRRSAEEHDRAVAEIAKVTLPAKDPVYGRDGPLFEVWKKNGEKGSRARAAKAV